MQSDTIGALAKALGEFQKAVKNPEKNRTVKVKGQTKAGKSYSYNFQYATLDNILNTIRDPMTKYGLAHVQLIAQDESARSYVETVLMHSSGEWISSRLPIQMNGTPQEMGSALSYSRRYALSAILGIASETDDDANAAEGNQIEDRTPAKPEAPPRSTRATVARGKPATPDWSKYWKPDQVWWTKEGPPQPVAVPQDDKEVKWGAWSMAVNHILGDVAVVDWLDDFESHIAPALTNLGHENAAAAAKITKRISSIRVALQDPAMQGEPRAAE